MSVTIDVNLAALNDIIDELGDAIDSAARPAAQAASQVLYDQVHANVARLGKKTGNLERAIYQAYSVDNSGPGLATYHIGWNSRKAPHGWLIENGHIQRYATYVGKDGKWHTAVRPEMRGKSKPKRRASQAEKDAYYMPRPGGPAQIPAAAFVRKAAVKMPEALAAAEMELLKRLAKG
jgi:hypothetical protein